MKGKKPNRNRKRRTKLNKEDQDVETGKKTGG